MYLLSKTVNTPLLLAIKDYRDSIDYRDIFRAAIVIVNFLLSPSTTSTHIVHFVNEFKHGVLALVKGY